jgi:hypothetical protein
LFVLRPTQPLHSHLQCSISQGPQELTVCTYEPSTWFCPASEEVGDAVA